MKIGILGSAFDPPHNAHIELAKRAVRVLKLDRLILMPTKIAPHKATSAVPPRTRFSMARLVSEGRKGWAVSDMELLRPGVSYTRDTITALKRKHPRDEIFWIIGSDGLVSMPWKWKGGYDILDLCTFVVGRRRGFPLPGVPRSVLKKVIVLPGRPTGFSSTHIRAMFREGKNPRRFLDPKVFAFIRRCRLYHHG